MPRVAEVAPAAPPRRSPRAPSFPLALAEMSRSSERAGGAAAWGQAPPCPAPEAADPRAGGAVTAARPQGARSLRATPPAAACPAETRPLPPLRLDPFGGPRRGPNLLQRCRHRLRRVPSSAKDRPRARTPVDF